VASSNDLLDRLRASIGEGDDWYAIERAFTAQVQDDEVDAARPAAYAFGYMLVGPGEEESRSRNGVFAPRIEWGDGSAFPPPLANVDASIRDRWIELFSALADHHAARARLGDLLWVTRHGERPDKAARAAVESYHALAEDPGWSLMDRVDSFARALELATELNDDDLRQTLIVSAVRFVRDELEQDDEHRPGVPLRVLERLVVLPHMARPPELSVLVAEAKRRYGEDPFIAESLTELELRLADDAQRAALRAEQVQRWRDAAGQAAGLVRLVHLRRAFELARATQQREVADQIALEIEGLSAEDLDLKTHTVSIAVPSEQTDALVARFGSYASACDALERFGIEGPPTGRAEDLDKAVTDLAERFPLDRLFPKQILGDHNSLIFEALTTEDHDRVDRGQRAGLGIGIFGPLAVRILDQIKDAYPQPTCPELTQLFTTELIDESTAARLASAVQRHWDGDYEGAGLILVAQIEAALRATAARLGISVTKLPRGGEPGGVVTLGALLAKLEGRMDESWRRYLVHLLTDPFSANLRNRLAHGLLDRSGPAEVAVLIHAACFVRSLQARGPDEQAANDAR